MYTCTSVCVCSYHSSYCVLIVHYYYYSILSLGQCLVIVFITIMDSRRLSFAICTYQYSIFK